MWPLRSVQGHWLEQTHFSFLIETSPWLKIWLHRLPHVVHMIEWSCGNTSRTLRNAVLGIDIQEENTTAFLYVHCALMKYAKKKHPKRDSSEWAFVRPSPVIDFVFLTGINQILSSQFFVFFYYTSLDNWQTEYIHQTYPTLRAIATTIYSNIQGHIFFWSKTFS